MGQLFVFTPEPVPGLGDWAFDTGHSHICQRCGDWRVLGNLAAMSSAEKRQEDRVVSRDICLSCARQFIQDRFLAQSIV